MRLFAAFALAGAISTAFAQTPDERLFEAIDESKPLVAEGLIVSGRASARARAPNGETPLHRAVERGMRDLAVLLLRSGASVRARSDSGETPLHLAALHGDPWFADLLLGERADPRARNDAGETPLHWAALTGNEATAQRLLARGADANIADIRGNLALHGAADSGDVATVRLLAGGTREPGARNRSGLTPVDVARERGFRDVVVLLGGRVDPGPGAARPADRTAERPASAASAAPSGTNIRSMDIDDPAHPRFQTY